MSDALQHYLGAGALRGEPLAGTHSGAAGGAPCGDLVRISLGIEDGVVAGVRHSASGCAAARAAAAAAAELLDGVPLAEAALLDRDRIDAELGGLTAVGAHAADLAAEAGHRALGSAVAEAGGRLLRPPGAGERVLVAMSGGVDSAVAALRERERGAEVWALTLELWSDPNNDGAESCCSAESVCAARAVAHSLAIPHLTVDLREAFRFGVVAPFLAGHAAGTTPNPCVLCNGNVRVDAMIAIADRLGAAALATGHYARVDGSDPAGAVLTAAADPAKDQTYMLAGLAPGSLERLRFPLADLRKAEVRAIAESAGLAVARRPESQDLCFLAGEGKRAFLARHGGLGVRSGEIVDRTGRRRGSHEGHHNFTVGQRRGIGVAADEPLYVLATDAGANRVVVGTADELETRSVAVHGAVLHREAASVDSVRLRYRSKAQRCSVRAGEHDGLRVLLEDPVRAPAPGQTAVFYAGDRLVGHATIA